MYYWKFGEADGWIRKDVKKSASFQKAYSRSPAGSVHVFLYDNSTLIASKDLTSYLTNYAAGYGVIDPANPADLLAHKAIWKNSTAGSRGKLFQEMKKEVLKLLEKQREQSNRSRPKRRSRRY